MVVTLLQFQYHSRTFIDFPLNGLHMRLFCSEMDDPFTSWILLQTEAHVAFTTNATQTHIVVASFLLQMV